MPFCFALAWYERLLDDRVEQGRFDVSPDWCPSCCIGSILGLSRSSTIVASLIEMVGFGNKQLLTINDPLSRRKRDKIKSFSDWFAFVQAVRGTVVHHYEGEKPELQCLDEWRL